MKTSDDPNVIRVGIVGPCTSGKTTLIANLQGITGIELRHIAQEHSYVPTMWEQISHPRLLIYLDVTYPISLQRKPLNWTISEYEEQLHRLDHARQHADFYLLTDNLTPGQVADQVRAFLTKHGIGRKTN